MNFLVEFKEKSYNVYLEKGILSKISSLYPWKNKIVLITDDGVPSTYIDEIINQYPSIFVWKIPQGEDSKSSEVYLKGIRFLLEHNIDRDDLIIYVGGGVVSDLAGFIAATYKRGIHFIGVPTTLLGMVDAAIGGKVAINEGKIKNCIGTFVHPNALFIDPLVLDTLSSRQFNNGLIEILKMGLIYDTKLYDVVIHKQYKENIKNMIYKAIVDKVSIVQQDEKDHSIRKILNFGHTFGHAFESYSDFHKYLHGEAVGLGMLLLSQEAPYFNELKKFLIDVGLFFPPNIDYNKLLSYIMNDKKKEENMIDLVLVPEVGKAYIKKTPINDLKKFIWKEE